MIEPTSFPALDRGARRLCHDFIVKELEAIPAPLNYRGPGAAVPGIHLHVGQSGRVPRHPPESKLKKGDMINIDVTVIKDGFHGDTSRMFFVGEPVVRARRLVAVTRCSGGSRR